MPLLLPIPEQQFVDANGKPYAGGFVYTYVPGTNTPKTTWKDNAGSAANSQPIVLDAAGRALIFGDGDYRLVLQDAANNLVYDQWTSSTISDAMMPVVTATSIANAQTLLGITDFSGSISAEQARAQAAEATLTTNLNSEITRATNAENNLQSQVNSINTSLSTASIRAGTATTNSSGQITVAFSPAFSTSVVYFTVMSPTSNPYVVGPQPPAPQVNATIISASTITTTGGTFVIGQDTGSGPPGYLPYAAGVDILWYAIGH